MKARLLAACAAALLLAGCNTFKVDDGRFTASYRDYGADVMLTADGELDQVFLQGPVGKKWLGGYEVHTGETPDGREYIQVIRQEAGD